MPENFPLKIINNHLLIFIEGESSIPWVFDTGHPQTFGNSNQIIINGESFNNIPSSYRNSNAQTISGFVGTTVNGLIGSNILNNFDIVMDISKKEVNFGNYEEISTNVIPIIDFLSSGCPVIEVLVNNSLLRASFNTGAQISYLLDLDMERKYKRDGFFNDFHPEMGEFKVPTYQVPITLGNAKLNYVFGNPPVRVHHMFNHTSVIIGADIFNFFSRIGFYPKRRKLML